MEQQCVEIAENGGQQIILLGMKNKSHCSSVKKIVTYK